MGQAQERSVLGVLDLMDMWTWSGDLRCPVARKNVFSACAVGLCDARDETNFFVLDNYNGGVDFVTSRDPALKGREQSGLLRFPSYRLCVMVRGRFVSALRYLFFFFFPLWHPNYLQAFSQPPLAQ